MQQPHTCPVCNGRGTVRPGFYPDKPDARQKCRTCKGEGIVWGGGKERWRYEHPKPRIWKLEGPGPRIYWPDTELERRYV